MNPPKEAPLLTANREAFDAFVYTSWQEALSELQKRAGDTTLQAYINSINPEGIPEIMEGKKSMVLFRHMATPNYEIVRFLMAADTFEELQPLILEYTHDKFTNRNEWKFSLAKLRFQKGIDRHGNPIIEAKGIIDVNASNNKALKDIETLWGQSLVDFHHDLFKKHCPHFTGSICDVSEWLHKAGTSAKDYYKPFLTLFLKDGILFENFLIEGKENQFTEEVILPALREIIAETGYKPLIVPLEPTHIEGDLFWLSHPSERKKDIDTLIS